jgi:hypothetical protein
MTQLCTRSCSNKHTPPLDCRPCNHRSVRACFLIRRPQRLKTNYYHRRAMWGMRTCVESGTVPRAHCLGNRPQEASDELLETRMETGADRGAEPDVQQAAQAEDEERSSRSGRSRGPTRTSPIQTKFTDPWDESYNAMDDYWYY